MLIVSSSVQSKIVRLANHRGERVRVSGWVHRKRDQQEILFVVLRDGTGYLQAVFTGQTVSITYCLRSPFVLTKQLYRTKPMMP